MKLFVVAFACACFLALSTAESNAVDSAAADEPSAEYLPPAAEEVGSADTKLADDGYRYKTVRRLKYRHRRAVSQEYLPPPVESPNQEYLPPNSEPQTKVAEDGYRYKTVRKLKFRARHRRDVSELPSNEYLPPVDVELAPELKTVVGADGYRYKTVRRLKYRRHRREAEADAAPAGDDAVAVDAAPAPANEYLPPASAKASESAVAEEPAQDSAVLAKDGYRYKTVRRIRYRYRH